MGSLRGLRHAILARRLAAGARRWQELLFLKARSRTSALALKVLRPSLEFVAEGGATRVRSAAALVSCDNWKESIFRALIIAQAAYHKCHERR